MATRMVIIGGGPAGNQAATTAARLGAEVTLIERDVVGGAAHLWDCIPSKAMIATGGAMADMAGGTFTISNGGVYGSLMSTPILNAPQSGILGMHKIQERPVAIDGKVEIRPMMYLALSYDHRLIDGKEAVQFLVAIKEMIENPAKILLEL